MSMKQLVYRLTNGTVVKTLREAMVSGQGYKSEYVTIQTPTPMSQTRATMLAENGYIKPVGRVR